MERTNLLVYRLLLVFDLLLELLELRAVGCRSIRLQHLNVPIASLASCVARCILTNLLIGKRCDLLLFYFVVGEVLLVFLPAGPRGGGHVCSSGDEGSGADGCSGRYSVRGTRFGPAGGSVRAMGVVVWVIDGE